MNWPKSLLVDAKDDRGNYVGSKTATLEVVGILLPFLSIPRNLAGKNLLFRVDNMAVVYGFQKRFIKFDAMASIIIRAIHIMAAFRGCTIHVHHVPRVSGTWAKLADHLSRESSTKQEDIELIEGARKGKVKGRFLSWLEDPRESWELSMDLLEELKAKL